VCGSANADLICSVVRFPHPGETLTVERFALQSGGKGLNQAVAATRFGAPCALIACVGIDAFGDELIGFLASQCVDASAVRRSAHARTGCAVVTSAQRENTIVVVPGANADLRVEDLPLQRIRAGDVLLAQLETPTAVTATFFRAGRRCGARSILSFAPAIPAGRELLPEADVVVMNETELDFLAGRSTSRRWTDRGIAAALRAIRTSSGQWLIVTLGHRGCAALIDAELLRVAGRSVEVVDSVGAGDCFAGVLAAELLRGAPISVALATANAAASISVQRPGAAASMPRRDEVGA
jgi:ribokinase